MPVSAGQMREYRRSHPDYRVQNRWLVRTQNRALRRLAQEFPDRFRQLLTEERINERDPRLSS